MAALSRWVEGCRSRWGEDWRSRWVEGCRSRWSRTVVLDGLGGCRSCLVEECPRLLGVSRSAGYRPKEGREPGAPSDCLYRMPCVKELRLQGSFPIRVTMPFRPGERRRERPCPELSRADQSTAPSTSRLSGLCSVHPAIFVEGRNSRGWRLHPFRVGQLRLPTRPAKDGCCPFAASS